MLLLLTLGLRSILVKLVIVSGAGTLAFCWVNARRALCVEAKSGNAPVAKEVFRRIAKLYEIETRIRGSSADHARAVRQAESAIIIADMQPWLKETLPKLARDSKTAEAIGYTLNHRKGLIRFLKDGRVEVDTNTAELSIRSLTLHRKKERKKERTPSLQAMVRVRQTGQYQSLGISHRRPLPDRAARRCRSH